MSYIERLIERATNTKLDLENNKIGCYSITPQHGNILVYHINKSSEFLLTIIVSDLEVIITYNKTIATSKEISDTYHILTELYGTNKEIKLNQI